MEIIGYHPTFSFLSGSGTIRRAENDSVRKDVGLFVESYAELAKRVAELAFYNHEHLLFFRGQKSDYKNRRGNSSIKPAIFRPKQGEKLPPDLLTLANRYRKMVTAEDRLVQGYERNHFKGLRRLQRYRILRWAILQHYEICPTPLLDVTHSLRVAASFASVDQTEEAYVFVLGLPNLAGSVTACSEQGVQIIRLSSICPPLALRPHFQEGYLVGEYPELLSVDEKKNYEPFEVDFGQRLLAKFRFNPSTFWKDPDFPPIDQDALYPNLQDEFWTFAQEIKSRISPLVT